MMITPASTGEPVSVFQNVCDTKSAKKVRAYINPEILQYYPLHSSLLLKFIYVRLINSFR